MTGTFLQYCLLTLTLMTFGLQCCATLSRRSLSEYSSAVCIDGTPAAFYHSRNHDHPAAKRFVIYLNGGGYCPGIGACRLRCYLAPQLCTSPADPVRYQYGILSDDPKVNPFFSSWYKVDVPYCSGDMFAGRRGPSSHTDGMAFTGSHILAAVIASLGRENIGLAEEVLLTGSSAGGAGVVFNCDALQAALPAVRVRCVVDGAFMYPLNDAMNNQSTCQTIQEILRIGSEVWNAPEVTSFPLQKWWKYIRTPVFVGNALYDEFGFDIFCGDRMSKKNVTHWAIEVSKMTNDMILNRPDIGIFMPGCFSHMMLTNDVMFGQLRVGVRQMTYGESLYHWLHNEENLLHSIDMCPLGIPCNDKCESIY